MPISIANAVFHKSVFENAGNQSLGGAIGGQLSSQIPTTQPAVVTGCYVSQAFGNPPGYGTISYNPNSQQLGWKPPGSSTTYYVTVTASGSYTVGNATAGILIVTVTTGALPSIYKFESVEITHPIGAVFGQVTTTMALVGDVQYRCLYFKNNHATLTANDVRLYVHAPAPLPQTIELGLDPAGVGNGSTTGVAQTIATPATPPVGVVFSAPTQAVNGILLGTIAPLQSVAFWQKRTVPPMSYGVLSIAQVTLGVALVG